MRIFRKTIKLRGGATLSIFFNRESELLVVDKNRRDERGGNEFVRVHMKDVTLPTTKELNAFEKLETELTE